MAGEILNTTRILELGQPEILRQCHQLTAIPAMIQVFVVIVFVLLIAAVAHAKSRRSQTFWGLFALVAVVGLITVTALSMMPNVVQFLASLWK